MRTRLAVSTALDLMKGPGVSGEAGGRRFDTARVALMQMLFGTSPTHYANVLRDLCFRLDDMLAWPLPRAVHFIYPLLRIPLWLWRKFAPPSRPRRETGSA